MILVVSTLNDDHTNAVLEHLEDMKVSARLLDLSAFPQQLRLVAHYEISKNNRLKIIDSNGEAIDLSDIGVIWWWRPQPFLIHPEITHPDFREFAYNESRQALSGLWHSIDVFWVNPPASDETAHHKSFQLHVAQGVGLDIPRTLITNDPWEARQFIQLAIQEDTVFKTFMNKEKYWRETRIIKPTEYEMFDDIRFAPVIFQEYIEAIYDLRIIVIDETVFATAIYSQETAYPADYRMEFHNARVEPVTIPKELQLRLLKLLRRLGLVYAAIDMRLASNNKYVFLEINPAGQWLFIEERTGQPITHTVAEFLASKDPVNSEA